jgi:hypothetical protein
MSRLRFAAMLAVMGTMSLVGAFSAVAVFMEAKPVQAEGESKTVTATSFQLVDGAGKSRGIWAADDDTVAFSLLDSKERPRLTMANEKKRGTVITFTDNHGKNRMTQAVTPEGLAIITYFHPDGETVAFQVSTTGEGESSLILYDKSKKNSILASVLADGRSVIALEHDEVTRFRTMIGTNGEPEMGFIEKGEKGLRYTWQAGGK